MADQVRLDKVGDLITALTTEHVTAFMSADGESGHATVMKIIEAVLTYLGAPVIMEGDWDASVGTFPGGGEAKKGWSYIVTTAGTVDGVDFNANDRLIAKANNASATTFESNWFKADYTDQVLSVAGLTGAISQSALSAALTDLMPKTGGSFRGNVDITKVNPSLVLNKTTTVNNNTITGNNAGLSRWTLFLGDTQDQFRLRAYRDDGTVFEDVLSFDRASGAGLFTRGVRLGAGLADPGTGKINAVDYQINGDSVVDALADRAKLTNLASADPGKGAAMVGVEAIAGLPDVTDVQTAIEALTAAIIASSGIGVGQTWKDVKASKVKNTVYQNTTGKPIQTAGRYQAAGNFKVSNDNVTWVDVSGAASGDNVVFNVIIPDGGYYQVATSGNIWNWAELS